MIKKLAICVVLLSSLVACGNDKSTTSEQTQKILLSSPTILALADYIELSNVEAIVVEEDTEIPQRWKDVKQIKKQDVTKETIKDLDINFIIGEQADEEQAKVFEELKIDSVFMNISTTSNVMQSLKELDEYLEVTHTIEKVVEQFQKDVKDYLISTNGQNSRLVLVLTQQDGEIQMLSETSVLGNLIKISGGILCGGDNLSQPLITFEPDKILIRNPMIIIKVGEDTSKIDELLQQEEWEEIDALKNNKVFTITEKAIPNPTEFKYNDTMKEIYTWLYEE